MNNIRVGTTIKISIKFRIKRFNTIGFLITRFRMRNRVKRTMNDPY